VIWAEGSGLNRGEGRKDRSGGKDMLKFRLLVRCISAVWDTADFKDTFDAASAVSPPTLF
jgi:hypothetical protein